LLVVEGFKDASGVEWREGDRAPLSRRSVRLVALAHPELFVMEYETASADLAWLREFDARNDAEFERQKARRGNPEARRQKALRKELEEQQRGDPKDLESRYKKQEAEREEHKKRLRAARERQQLEDEFALDRPLSPMSFHGN
jgi:hypothetical protein